MARDVYQVIKDDHKEVRRLMGECEKGGDRKDLFRKIKDGLLAHSKAEEESLYPRLEKIDDLRDEMRDARKEHKQVERLLEEIDGFSGSDTEWMTKFRTLKENVEKHISEEEGKVFPTAKKHLTQEEANNLGTQWEELRRRYAKVA